MYYKIYKKLFVRSAFKLFWAGAGFRLVSFFAGVAFAKARRRTRLLAFTDRWLTRSICRCHELHRRCMYLERKLSKERVPVF